MTGTPGDAETVPWTVQGIVAKSLCESVNPGSDVQDWQRRAADDILAALSGAGMVVLDPNNLPEWLTHVLDEAFWEPGSPLCPRAKAAVPESIRRAAGVL